MHIATLTRHYRLSLKLTDKAKANTDQPPPTMKFLMQLLITAGIGLYLLGKASAAEAPQLASPDVSAYPVTATSE